MTDDLKDLIPPNLDYAYFEAAQRYPFRNTAQAFDLVNASWLADAALLAYAELDFAGPRFQEAGLNNVRFVHGVESHTQGYVAANDDFAIVTFRGTEVINWKDVRTDVKVIPVQWDDGGKVHKGAKDALDEVWHKDGLGQHLNALKREKPARTFWFTGHSLGAAVATLATRRFGSGSALYTFGSPRPGNRDFAQGMSAGVFRFVNHNDVVPRLPPPGLMLKYRHVGTLKYITHDGRLRNRCTLRGQLRWFWREYVRRWFDESDGTVVAHAAVRLAKELGDHAPVNYARAIKNLL